MNNFDFNVHKKDIISLKEKSDEFADTSEMWRCNVFGSGADLD